MKAQRLKGFSELSRFTGIGVSALRAGLRAVLLGAVHAYRLLLSPCLGQRCRFNPSCSLYALQALRLHGNRSGSYLVLKRLVRCHPWCVGGHDPVPEPQTCEVGSISICDKPHT
jgi:uncharacterized protein